MRGPEYVNELIYEFIYLGGINGLNINNWKASDDTILYMATLHIVSENFLDYFGLTNLKYQPPIYTFTPEEINNFGNEIKKAYMDAIPAMEDRFPGSTTIHFLEKQQEIEWDKLSYDAKSIGAGSAMRSGSIGIYYLGERNRTKLVTLAVESSRITHNSAISILGSVVAALFTAFALEKIPINMWPHHFLKLMDSGIVDKYIEKTRPADFTYYVRDKKIYIDQWKKYIQLLFTNSGIDPRQDLKMMKNPVQRYKYLSENFSKGCEIPGSCGDDALIMAYDALLRSDGVLEKILVYSILHPGDSDTVGSIAFSWFGAFYHSPRNEQIIADRFADLEFCQKLRDFMAENIEKMARTLYYDIYMDIADKFLEQYIRK